MLVIGLACGADSIDNLQWQTSADAKLKDRLDLQCRGKRGPYSAELFFPNGWSMPTRKMKTDAKRNARNSARLEQQAETVAKWLIILELTLKQQLIRFLREDQGQDLIEYTLLHARGEQNTQTPVVEIREPLAGAAIDPGRRFTGSRGNSAFGIGVWLLHLLMTGVRWAWNQSIR